jgi:arylsulfatase A-like enzyme/Tfp pilus assembly protein PilF
MATFRCEAPARRAARASLSVASTVVLSAAFVIAAAASLVITACRGRERGASTAAPAKQYNVLLITIDTMRADHLGAWGYTHGATPVLDRLAREGVRFESAQSPVPLTLPAHSSILSGLLPLHHTVRNNGGNPFPADRETLATVLSRSGYRTAAFVASFVLDHRFGLGRGFDTYDDDIPRDPADSASVIEAERPAEAVVDRALAWLDRADARPFFAWVHLYDPHAPYAPPEPYRTRFHDSLYDGEVAYVDAQIGRILDDLERRGLRDRTIVAVVGDHGEALGEHGELTHGLLLYEPTLHVPMIVSAPKVLAPRVVAQPIGSIDLAPTLAALVGAPMPPGLDGRDVSAALAAGIDPKPAQLYAETQYPLTFGWSDLAVLRSGASKFIRAPAPELYDLAHDPGEKVNVLTTERRAYRELSASLETLRGSAKAPKSVQPVDEETRAKLASLGYVAPTGAVQQGSAQRDPKVMAPLFRRFEEATWALNGGKPDAAIAAFESLVRDDPSNPVFRASLARTYRQQHHLDRAVVLYQEAVALNPNDPDAWYDAAMALRDAGRFRESAVALGEALRRDDRRPEAHNALGIAYASEGKLPEAEAEFRKTLQLDRRNARAYNNLGNVLRGMNRADEARQAYQQALLVTPNYPDALNGLGVLDVQADRPRDSLPRFDAALRLAPHYYEAQLNRGIALQMTGDAAGARAQFTSLLKQLPAGSEYAEQRTAAVALLRALH